MADFLAQLREYLRSVLIEPWKPATPVGLGAALLFYALFLLHAARSQTGFLIVDHVNLVVHEAGHLLFSYLGRTPMVWGGTILQWAFPFLLAAYFFVHRQTSAFAFCLFFFFENFLYTSVYMADARAQVLPLVSVGDPDPIAGHDWNFIFSQLGVLQHDTRIAGMVRFLGWLGMLSTVGWLGWRASRRSEDAGLG